MSAGERSGSVPLLGEIASLTAQLDARRGERGMVEGKRTSTPVSRRAPVDLDVLDAQAQSRQVLHRWAMRIQAEHVPRSPWRPPARVLREHWDWAVEQPWGPAMVADLEVLRDRLANGGRTVRLIPCPVCRLPVRVDTFAADHRECIDVPLDD